MTSPEQYRRAKDLFLGVCDLTIAHAEQRIELQAADDPEVAALARQMLRADRGASAGGEAALLRGVERGMGQLLEEATRNQPRDADREGGPTTIGPFRVIRRVGVGGMGEVYEAEQDTPRRRVAIKLMRPGLRSPDLLRRFQREIEFAGRLSHPGIAQVFEAGMTQVGSVPTPYFAMEFISGSPLTHFARERGLSLQARLAMFAMICDAVQYAHQQGVIHRDLKPANILVQEDGAGRGTGLGQWGTRTSDAPSGPPSHGTSGTWFGQGVPRILDFGVARAVESSDEGQTLATQAGQIIGTLAYMSPEQISGRLRDVDTRTDVYSLGVILFELLSGQLPFAIDGLPLAEVARVKASDPPQRLSAVDRTLRGDLETIVTKALEHDKSRRYASASELGADVRRYLSNEVILARPATVWYQARMFARRNRTVVAVGAGAVLALVGGIISTTLQARAAERERDVAVRKTAVAEGVSNLLLDALTVATPNGRGPDAKVMDALDRIERQADAPGSSISPEVHAVILNIAGIIRREQGDFPAAEARLARALEIRRQVLDPGDPNLADSINNMGLLRKRQGQLAEAADLYQQAIDLQRRSTFQDDQRLLRNLFNLATTRTDLAAGPEAAEQLALASSLLAEALTLLRASQGEDNVIAGLVFAAQGRVAAKQSRWDEAQSLAERALALHRKHAGPNHPHVMASLQDLAAVAAGKNDPERRLQLLREADDMAQKVYAATPRHPNRSAVRAALIEALRNAGRPDEADALEKSAAGGA